MENMLSILAPFEELSREIRLSMACVSDVIPSILALTRLLGIRADKDQGIQTAKRTLLDAVNRLLTSKLNPSTPWQLSWTPDIKTVTLTERINKVHLTCWRPLWTSWKHAAALARAHQRARARWGRRGRGVKRDRWSATEEGWEVELVLVLGLVSYEINCVYSLNIHICSILHCKLEHNDNISIIYFIYFLLQYLWNVNIC